ncbi:MAG: hypothetical protein WBO34_13770 [Gammaproteobacteria bacterium]
MPALGDVSLRIEDDRGTESLVYVSAGRCRIETEGMTGYTVINLRDHSLAYVDTGRGEYSTLSEAQLRRQLDQMDGVRQSLSPHMETLRNGLQALPAEQRALFEQFMAGKAPPGAGRQTTLVADGGMQRFAGLVCAHHRLMQGQRQVGDACLLQRAGGVMSRGDFSTLNMAMDLLRDLSGRVGGLLDKAGNKTVLLQTEATGIPVALRDYSSGESYRVVQASAARLDESLFSGHRVYRKVDAPALPGLF